MKILITGGTSATALKLLKTFSAHQVILADYGEVPSFSSAAYTLVSLGDRNDDTLAHTILNNCLDLAVDAVLPLQNYEIEALAKAEVLFNEFNIEVLLPRQEILAAYFTQGENVKADEYVVFIKGEIVFSTVENEFVALQGRGENLNGAYYFAHEKLYLITI